MDKKGIRTAYARWNVPEKFVADDAVTTPETLTELLSTIENRIPEMQCRVFPSSFDANDSDMRAFPRPIDWRWTSCENLLRAQHARVVMTRIPHFWQLESPVHACCRSAGAAIFTNEPENMAVGAAAIVSAGVDTIISEASGASAFTSFLVERDVTLPPLWLLIHKAGTDEWHIPAPLEQSAIRVAQEVHLFPGVPILLQCSLLAQHKKPRFHLSAEYVLENVHGESYITGTGDDPLPLYRFQLPFRLRQAKPCTCGKEIFEKI